MWYQVFFRPNAVLAALLWLLSVTGPAVGQALVTVRLEAGDIAHVLEGALKDTRIVLHNHGPLQDGSYFRKDGSYAIVGRAMGGDGEKQYFSIPEITRKLWRGRYAYYINDIRSLPPRIETTDKAFVLHIPFETRGAEMVGRCTVHKFSWKFWSKKNRETRACKGMTGAKVMPDIHWKNPEIEIEFGPVRYADSMSFYITRIEVKGDIDLGKICNWKLVGKKICARIARYKTEVKRDAGKMLMSLLSTPKVRHKIAKDIQRRIDRKTGTTLLKIKRLTMEKGVIRVSLGL